MENGVVIAETYVRSSIAPGEDYSQEDSRVQDICTLLHTPEAIAAYQAMIQMGLQGLTAP